MIDRDYEIMIAERVSNIVLATGYIGLSYDILDSYEAKLVNDLIQQGYLTLEDGVVTYGSEVEQDN